VSLEKIPPLPPEWRGQGRETIYEWNPHTIQELKDNISHAIAAIKITMLHRVYLNMIRRAQLCIDSGGNHLKRLLWWYILSEFGYCINFCIYAMLRTRATFSWPILYKQVGLWSCPRVARHFSTSLGIHNQTVVTAENNLSLWSSTAIPILQSVLEYRRWPLKVIFTNSS